MPGSAEALEAFWQTAQFAENCWLSVYCSTKWSLQEPLSSLLCKNKAKHRVFRIRYGCFHRKHRQWPLHYILPLTFSFLTCSLRLRSLWQTTVFGRLAFWGHALHSALHHSCSTGLRALVKTRTYTNSFPLKVKKAPVQAFSDSPCSTGQLSSRTCEGIPWGGTAGCQEGEAQDNSCWQRRTECTHPERERWASGSRRQYAAGSQHRSWQSTKPHENTHSGLKALALEEAVVQ